MNEEMLASRAPVYMSIKKYLLDGIEKGTWPAGERIPSEETLCRTFEVARGTVRQAVGELAAEGFVEKIHGKGTFVCLRKMKYQIDNRRFVSFYDELIDQKIDFETRVLEQKIIQTPSEAAFLRDAGCEQVFFLERLRRNSQMPIMLSRNYIPYARLSGLENGDYQNESLYQRMKNNGQADIDHASREFCAVAASEELAHKMQLPEKTPLMQIRQLAFDAGGQLVDCAWIWINSEAITISVLLKNG